MNKLLDSLRGKQKRHTKEEKNGFINFLTSRITSFGYDIELLTDKLFKTEHLATRSDDDPQVVFLAHYDTSTVLPLWVEWVISVFGHTRNLLSLILLLLISQAIPLIDNDLIETITKLVIAGSVLIPMLLIPNKNTMNDNTSGVLVLLLLAERISKHDYLKNKIKFVFTDNEEKSLVGSFLLKKRWNKQKFNYGNRIISVDSVGRGDNLVFTYNFVNSLSSELQDYFEGKAQNVRSINMYGMPFSDAFSFWKKGAVNINMMNKSLVPGGYYIKAIHSRRDKNLKEENINMIVDTLEEYIYQVCEPKAVS